MKFQGSPPKGKKYMDQSGKLKERRFCDGVKNPLPQGLKIFENRKTNHGLSGLDLLRTSRQSTRLARFSGIRAIESSHQSNSASPRH